MGRTICEHWVYISNVDISQERHLLSARVADSTLICSLIETHFESPHKNNTCGKYYYSLLRMSWVCATPSQGLCKYLQSERMCCTSSTITYNSWIISWFYGIFFILFDNKFMNHGDLQTICNFNPLTICVDHQEANSTENLAYGEEALLAEEGDQRAELMSFAS